MKLCNLHEDVIRLPVYIEKLNLEDLGFHYTDYEIKRLPVDLMDISEEGFKAPTYKDIYCTGEIMKMPPIAVIPKRNRYEVVDGARRLTSARACNIDKLPVMVLYGFKYHKSNPKLYQAAAEVNKRYKDKAITVPDIDSIDISDIILDVADEYGLTYQEVAEAMRA